MATDSFHARAIWGPRPESPSAIGKRVLRSADALSALHPLLQTWWVLDRYDAQDFIPLDPARARIASLVEDFVVRDDYDEPDPASGYNAALVNIRDMTPQTITVSTHGGVARMPRFSENAASFETEYDRVPDPALIAYPLFRAAMMCLAEVYEAPVAFARCSALLRDPRAQERLFQPSWMVYLAAAVAVRIEPPSDVLLERTADGGLLMIATEETFDPNNSAHVAAAWSISDALLPINARDF